MDLGQLGSVLGMSGQVTISGLRNFWQQHYISVTSIAVFGAGLFLLKRYFAGGVCRSRARLDGRTVLITGANTGIGKLTAKDLAGRGARVILACRDITKAERAAAEIRRSTGNSEVLVEVVDLGSLDSVRSFCERIKERETAIHILINNAGVMWCPKWQTADGFEMHFGTNHLGHFLLTNLLLDLVKSSSPSRIINVSSLAYETGKIDFDDINVDKDYNSWKAYSQSKLANILFTKELTRRLQGSGVTANCLHPGVVQSELSRHLPLTIPRWKRVIFWPIQWLVFKSTLQGTQTSIHCAVAPELDSVSGEYFCDCKVKKLKPHAMDEDAARRLWDLSATMVKLQQ